ncbi:hypothetical protein CVT26_007150 [Gymnopilus dilepis]|uniref:Uncharacterized protein n=1 Tax=Gymnopilus dilepis TaxID=231916 RepID=A0A409W6N2_9AGAR|nr:hypothetical protein CVT26_007150 [Gymnopilus dilepis]
METTFPATSGKVTPQPFVTRRPRKPSVVHWRTDSTPVSTSSSNTNSSLMDDLPELPKHPRTSSASHVEESLPASGLENGKDVRRGFRDAVKSPYAYVHSVPPTPLPELSREEVYRIIGITSEAQNVSTNSIAPWVAKLTGKKRDTEKALNVRFEDETAHVRPSEVGLEAEVPVGERYRISKPYPLGYKPKSRLSSRKDDVESTTDNRERRK